MGISENIKKEKTYLMFITKNDMYGFVYPTIILIPTIEVSQFEMSCL
jgi:hypothetical protein